jgi:hypothetical protein
MTAFFPVSRLGATVGLAVVPIVYTAVSATGAVASFTAGTGIQLIGTATAAGATAVVGPFAGAMVTTVATHASAVTSRNIDANTHFTAAVAGAIAGAVVTLSVTLVEQTVRGTVYCSRAALHRYLRSQQHGTPFDDSPQPKEDDYEMIGAVGDADVAVGDAVGDAADAVNVIAANDAVDHCGNNA